MGNLAANPEYLALMNQAQQRNLSRYGNRESIDPVPSTDGHWFALRCHGRAERLAAEGLSARGFDTYLPVLWIKERPRRGGVRETERPMFSTYIFIRCLARGDHWNKAHNVAGVRQIVGEVPNPAIDAIRLSEACFATKSGRKALRWNFRIDQEVRVSSGPFAYFHAQILSAVDDRGRIMALVSVFGRASRVEFNADQLEKL